MANQMLIHDTRLDTSFQCGVSAFPVSSLDASDRSHLSSVPWLYRTLSGQHDAAHRLISTFIGQADDTSKCTPLDSTCENLRMVQGQASAQNVPVVLFCVDDLPSRFFSKLLYNYGHLYSTPESMPLDLLPALCTLFHAHVYYFDSTQCRWWRLIAPVLFSNVIFHFLACKYLSLPTGRLLYSYLLSGFHPGALSLLDIPWMQEQSTQLTPFDYPNATANRFPSAFSSFYCLSLLYERGEYSERLTSISVVEARWLHLAVADWFLLDRSHHSRELPEVISILNQLAPHRSLISLLQTTLTLLARHSHLNLLEFIQALAPYPAAHFDFRPVLDNWCTLGRITHLPACLFFIFAVQACTDDSLVYKCCPGETMIQPCGHAHRHLDRAYLPWQLPRNLIQAITFIYHASVAAPRIPRRLAAILYNNTHMQTSVICLLKEMGRESRGTLIALEEYIGSVMSAHGTGESRVDFAPTMQAHLDRMNLRATRFDQPVPPNPIF